ncbi:hypothetical protein PQG02_12390 [Nostoc sp. UHCC 0926]|uniref:hypothetical protein n=1 Tax=Nostoc sp. UHCC 0926 TaxID=3025190 RepID=UPI00235F5469|nr:hypothetical protein [Nostoc sp. UHCC 0926]WDD35062.1 hypothetical protein PQG02_12390 [Nostoc sp. UHCC 0926]
MVRYGSRNTPYSYNFLKCFSKSESCDRTSCDWFQNILPYPATSLLMDTITDVCIP